ncbi:DNA-binding response OmpR family regulator [Sphingomonas zeicaulis]|uniref:response regulator n=1 Tax=Sphingomonas zeicaulis TaxID=1632740 RepID=UPI003D263ECA
MSSQKPFAGLNLLVVEDEYLLADDIAAMAESRGARVQMANSVDGALALVQRGDVDAAILDAGLRGTLSDAVAEQLAQQAIPTLVVTGYDREALPPVLATLPYLCKPFSTVGLSSALEKLVSDAASGFSEPETGQDRSGDAMQSNG